MQKTLFRVLLLLVAAMGTSVFASAQTVEPRKGVVRVKLQPEMARNLGDQPIKVRNNQKIGRYSQFNGALNTIKAVSIRPAFPANEKYAADRARYGLDCWYEITFDESVSPYNARKLLSGAAGVQKATVKKPLKLFDGDAKYTIVSPEAMASRASSTMPFNDPRLREQWHYNNTGTMVDNVEGADINLFEAWKITTGSPDVIVAIIDGGIDVNHEDLKANLYVNEAELNGVPGQDDDGDGYVDNIYGYNFCTRSGVIYPHDHGTHVAGTVAAVNNNGKGVAGVAGGDGTPNSGIRMISCQVFDSRAGVPSQGDFAEALIYAKEHGASIAQCSWGWEAENEYEEDVLDAIRYFTAEARSSKLAGGLCIFAAGNSGATGKFYPACMDEVLSVGAMTCSLQPASYSNYGEWVDVIAPGGLLDYSQNQGVLSTLPNDQYGFMEGTSMACPHVSGIAALVLSKHGSPTLTADALKTQIETSVNDFYALNPDAAGLYGSGYVDAYKALQMGTGSAPQPVGAITALPSQESITLQWIIPESGDHNVNNHILYYSTSPFTETSLDKTQQKVIDTKFSTSGDAFEYELTGLQPLTTYYIALKAVDRWANASALSEVVTASTNAGPNMGVDKNSLSINITNGAVVPGQFVITNDADGRLKWNFTTQTKSASISALSLVKMNSPYKGNMGLQKAPAQRASAFVAADFEQADYPKQFNYFNNIEAFIGDMDASLPNSMAQMFTVDASRYPEGFNLTHLNVQGSGTHSPTVAIYRGTSLNEANKLTEFTPSYFSYYLDVQLEEQFYFAPGESFFVVLHFPASDTLYPLGVAQASSEAAAATQAYMSNDNGRTWTLLSEALKGSKYAYFAEKATYALTVKSLNPDWSQVLTLTPAGGTIDPHATQEVEVGTSTALLCNGTYRFNLGFETNETAKNDDNIAVTLTVSGQKPDITVRDIIDFGSLIVGQQKTITVEVFNKGYGAFAGNWGNIYDVQSTNDNFAPPSDLSGIGARSTAKIDITFAPKVSGSQSGKITFADKSGNTFSIMVQGVATDPAKIVFEPETVEVGDIEVGGESKEVTFEVKNEGTYPLQYVFPKFSGETIEGMGNGSVHRFGYTAVTNLRGSDAIEYDGGVQMISPVDITRQFSESNLYSAPIAVGFDFPYYGKTYSQVYISTLGGIAFDKYTDYVNTPLAPDNDVVKTTSLISGYGIHELEVGPQTKIQYAKQSGKFIVNFENVLVTVYDKDKTAISYHMAISPNGDIEIYYDNYDPWSVFQNGSGLYCGISDFGSDPLSVTEADMYHAGNTLCQEFGSGTAVKFVAPQPNMVTALAPADGLVAPGEAVTITATVAATEDMYAGEIVNNIIVNSNDLVNPAAVVSFKANVVGDLHPVLSAETTVDFGDVFRTSKAVMALNVANAGRAEMAVTAVTVDGEKFSIDAAPFKVAAGQSKDLFVTLDTQAEGSFTGSVSIESDGGNATVDLVATVIGCPGAQLSYTEVDETLNAGEAKQIPLTITNNGNEPLAYTVSVGDGLEYTPSFSDVKSISYNYAMAVENPSVTFDWIDNTKDEDVVFTSAEYYFDHDFTEVELPFEFTFYGNKYRKMYVYNSGFVSFTYRDDQKLMPEPPAEFPQGSYYDNLIAPYWGFHSMDFDSPTSGTYVTKTESSVVVTFTEFGNSVNAGVCFQLIMNSDGSFKFQYNPNNSLSLIFATYGVAGISSVDAKEGVAIPSRGIAFGNAVEFYPVVEASVAPGASAVADIAVSPDLMGGDYTSAITLTTNVPGSEVIEIPVALHIIGEAKPVYPSDITLENPAMKEDMDWDDELIATFQGQVPYYALVEVKNEGTAPFTITNIAIESQMIEYYDDRFGEMVEEPAFQFFFTYGESIDWMTGEPVKGWNMYDGSPIEVGKEPGRIAVGPMTGSPVWMNQGEYWAKLHIFINDEEEEAAVVNIKFITTGMPAASLDKEEIRVTNAAPDHRSTEVVTLSNDGDYRLDYTITVDLTGQGESVEEDPGIGFDPLMLSKARVLSAASKGDLPKAEPVTHDYGKDTNMYNLPQNFEYLNGLYYPVQTPVSGAYQFGDRTGQTDLYIMTTFTVPAEGFNVSHLYSGGYFGATVDYDVHGYIFDGPYGTGNMVAEGVYTHAEAESNTAYPTMFVLKLNRAVNLTPGTEFTAVIQFPAGLSTMPAMLMPRKDDPVTGRYLGMYGEGDSTVGLDAADFYTEQGLKVGWMLSCLETASGEDWVKVAEESASGSVAPGESVEIPVAIYAGGAPLDVDNKAMLVIKSNDPGKIINFPVYLDKNRAPVITVPATTTVPEKETANLTVSIVDPDGDDFMFAMTDNGRVASLDGIVANPASATVDINKQTGVVTVKDAESVDINFTLAPDYGDAGSYAITVVAKDNIHSQVEAQARYVVEKVNRAPEAVPFADITIAAGSSSAVVNYADLFTDADGDELTYTLSVSDEKVAQPFTSAASVIFAGIKEGKATVTVTATDTSGASATNTFNVLVDKLQGITDITIDASTSVYPNPVVDDVNVVLDFDAKDVVYSIYSISGGVAYSETADAFAGEAHVILMTSLPAGTYLLQVATADGRTASEIIVKK